MTSFETQKNRKAFLYTLGVCGALLLLMFLISWTTPPPSVPVAQDLIDINLGNLNEGLGDVQPLIKGSRSPETEESTVDKRAASQDAAEKVDPDDYADNDAAPVIKTNKKDPRSKSEKPNEDKVTRPQKPKLTYNGAGNQNGNNPDEDNGYRNQGNNANGKGDMGSAEGNKDSYGNSPGGRTGNGPQVTKGNRRIVKAYAFTGNLGKATIYAVIRVTPSGKGTFLSFDKGSSTRNPAYKDAIISYLNNMSFNSYESESIITVRFNFNLN